MAGLMSRILMTKSAGLYPKSSNGTGRRRKRAKVKAASRKRRSTKRAGKVKMRKGSAAAKAWGAKMKRLRKRRG